MQGEEGSERVCCELEVGLVELGKNTMKLKLKLSRQPNLSSANNIARLSPRGQPLVNLYAVRYSMAGKEISGVVALHAEKSIELNDRQQC